MCLASLGIFFFLLHAIIQITTFTDKPMPQKILAMSGVLLDMRVMVFIIILLTTFPTSSSDVFLNKWVLNITLKDNGTVEEVIQMEIQNNASSALDGFSFVIPASKVTILHDQIISIPATGQVVKQEVVPNGIRVIIIFNTSIEADKKWNGRVVFTAENWAVKQAQNYSIDIPVEPPVAIISGKDTFVAIPEDADIRAQVFLPESVEVISVTPRPFRILFQYDHMVPTWTPDKLRIGDTISIKASFSEVLNKIVETDKKIKELSQRLQDAKQQGMDVSEAESYLTNAMYYNNRQALGEFWKKNSSAVIEYVGYANDELNKAEVVLSSAGKTQTQEKDNKKTPGFGAQALISILLITFLLKRVFFAMLK